MLVGLFIISIRPKYGELRGVVKEGYCVLHSLTDLFYRWTVTRESSPVHRGLHRINSEDTLAGTSVCTDPSQHPDQYIHTITKVTRFSHNTKIASIYAVTY